MFCCLALDIEKTLYLIGITRLNLTLTRNSRTAMLIPIPRNQFQNHLLQLIFIGFAGASKKKDELLYLSPFTSKMTFVLDQRLANQGLLVLRYL
jgi:hypothetical protein